MTEMNIQSATYSGQTRSQRRNGGGVGRSRQSHWKHEAIKRAMHRQLPVLRKRGRGLIIDMHAGDGKETLHPQPDMWAGGALITTPHLALSHARIADVWLCEKGREPRRTLIEGYGEQAKVLANHNKLLNCLDEVRRYPWVLVLNDPNGPSEHGIEVMNQISHANAVSDFVIVVNRGAIKRILGVGKSDNSANQFALNVEASQPRYAWMMTPANWAKRLQKRHALATVPKWISNEMTAQIILVSNFIPGMGR